MPSLQELRERNRARVLVALRVAGSADREELVRVTRLSRATVSGLLGEAIARGHVVEDHPGRHATGRRRPAMLRLDPRAGVVAGVDLGHTHVRVVLGDLQAATVGQRQQELDVDAAPGKALDTAARLVEELLRSADLDAGRLLGAAMGVARPLIREDQASIPVGWRGASPGEALAGRLGVPVRVENDANLGVLGEHAHGAARGVKDVVYVKLASGVGAGLLLDGSLYVGSRGIAGELGHVTVVPQGHICRCGNRGCLETVAGAEAISRAEGDGAAREAGRYVGRALAALCTTLDVELVVIGGELGAVNRPLVGAVRSELRKSCATREPIAVRAALLGDRAEVLGAVALALRQDAWLQRAGLIALDAAA